MVSHFAYNNSLHLDYAPPDHVRSQFPWDCDVFEAFRDKVFIQIWPIFKNAKCWKLQSLFIVWTTEENIDRPGRGQPCGIVELTIRGKNCFCFLFICFVFHWLLALQHVAINRGKHSPWLGKLFRFQFHGLSFHLSWRRRRMEGKRHSLGTAESNWGIGSWRGSYSSAQRWVTVVTRKRKCWFVRFAYPSLVSKRARKNRCTIDLIIV